MRLMKDSCAAFHTRSLFPVFFCVYVKLTPVGWKKHTHIRAGEDFTIWHTSQYMGHTIISWYNTMHTAIYCDIPCSFTENVKNKMLCMIWVVLTHHRKCEMKSEMSVHSGSFTGHTDVKNMKLKCVSVLLCHWTLRLGFYKDFYNTHHDTDITKINTSI